MLNIFFRYKVNKKIILFFLISLFFPSKGDMSEVQMDKSKNKSIGRISRLFQKKPKSKTSITSSISSLSISDPILSKQPSFQSISSAQLSIAEKPPRNSSLDSKNLPSLPAHQENDNVSVITIETGKLVSHPKNSVNITF